MTVKWENQIEEAVEKRMRDKERLKRIFGEPTVDDLTVSEITVLGQLQESTLWAFRGVTRWEVKEVIVPLAKQDRSRLDKLGFHYRRRLLTEIRYSPCKRVVDVQRSLRKFDVRIEQPVQGLYESVSPANEPTGWEFKNIETPGAVPLELETRVTAHGNKLGVFLRSYDVRTGTLEGSLAFRRNLPAYIPSSVPLSPKRGTPTVAYVTMYQMKRLGCLYGRLSMCKLSTIQNIETLCHLHWLRQRFPERDPGELVRHTHSVRYMETALVQSGHKVVNSRIEKSETWKVGELTSHYERKELDISRGQGQISLLKGCLSWYRKRQSFTRVLDKYGLDRDTEVECNYDIYLDLQPFG